MRFLGSRAQASRLAKGLTFSSCRIMVNRVISMDRAEDIPSSDIVAGGFEHGATVCKYCGTKFLYKGIEQCGVC